MKYYSYRPPRLIRNPSDSKFHHKKRASKKLLPLVFGLMVVGFLSWTLWPRELTPPALLSAALNESTRGGMVEGVSDVSASSPLDTMVPFLTTQKNTFEVQQNPIQAMAVGGASTELNNLFEAKSGLSVSFDTGETFYAYNAQARLPMASITKVMTAMVALDLASKDELFTVSRSATTVEPTVMGVLEGEKLTTGELVEAALLMSANDAAQVLAEAIGAKYAGGHESFVEAMNEKARLLGLKNTRFTNPQGYDNPNHYSTCEDLIVMSRYAITYYPDIARVVREKEKSVPATATHQNFWLPNWNMLIGTYPGAEGVKIGNTGEAGHTTVASANREGKRVMACVLGASGILKRDMAAAELLNYGFAQQDIAPYPITEDLLRTRIRAWY